MNAVLGLVVLMITGAPAELHVRDRIVINDPEAESPYRWKDFGEALCPIGDLDNNGVLDLAVGAPSSNSDGGQLRGAVWILFLRPDGGVLRQAKIGFGAEGFAPSPDDFGAFGSAITTLDDLDGDGISELAVGEPRAQPDGAVWVLFPRADGAVDRFRRIPFPGPRREGRGAPTQFGAALAGFGAVDSKVGVGVARQQRSIRAARRVSAPEWRRNAA